MMEREPAVLNARSLLEMVGRLDRERYYDVEVYSVPLDYFRDFQGKRGYAIYFEGRGEDAGSRKAITTADGYVLSIGLARDAIDFADKAD